MMAVLIFTGNVLVFPWLFGEKQKRNEIYCVSILSKIVSSQNYILFTKKANIFVKNFKHF